MKQEDTRERILEQALELFSENGYDSVSVGEIARAVGTKLVPAQYFGAVERFSVFAATGFNAAPFRQAILRHWSAAYEAFYLKSGQ